MLIVAALPAAAWSPRNVSFTSSFPSNAHAQEIVGIEDEIPLGRIGNADEIAHAIEFLASDKSDYITGQILGINGGYVI